MDLLSEYLVVDQSSPTGLRWVQKPNARISIGQPAMTCILSNGYYTGGFKGKNYYAHRVVFYLANGYWPARVDHIDGNRQNNTPSNLRDISQAENAHNTLAAGCYFDKAYSKWRARIKSNGHTTHLGYYATKQEARAAYLAAKVKLHPTAPERCYGFIS